MRFDELILQVPDDELRVRFHPELTVLCGLGPDERRSLADGILGALTGGPDRSELRYLDGGGEPVIVRGQDGRITAERLDGTPVAPPLGTVAPDRVALRSLMLVSADGLGVLTRAARDDEPPELRDARDMLDELTAELDAARGQQQAVEALQTKLEAVEAELSAALDGAARREYAQILARLERVRAEAAALQTGTAGIDADRHLLANADATHALAAEWAEANAVLTDLATRLDGQPRLGSDARDRAARIPARPPEQLPELIAALQDAFDVRDALDHRLQALSVAKLPAPSDPLVAELGLLDQTVLWRAAARCVDAGDAMHNVQLSLGGLELDEMGPPPAVIEEIESAHSAVEDAEGAAEAARVPALAGIGVGLAIALLGLVTVPLIAPAGLAGGVFAVFMGILRPRARQAHAARVERGALLRADATSYLAFHIRRVEASVDPKLRELVEATAQEQRAAAARWIEVAGPQIDVAAALALREEIEAYHDALRNLGETADEIEQLRRELEDAATPALARAQDAIAQSCAPYLLDDAALDPAGATDTAGATPVGPTVAGIAVTGIAAAVAMQCDRGAAARAQIELDDAEVDEQKIADRLDDLLLQLGFDAGPIDARVGALDWAVSRAAEREDARRQARPREEIDAELRELQDAAAQLRRPEWATVTAADAATPDIPELEAERAEILAQITAARADVDVERLADRHAAVERRVAALEARHIGHEANGDPGAIADIQQHLLAHLTTASQAGPDRDPVPVVLDEVFLRVPADRKWDLLDLLHRLAERHQLVYLSDDAFVAAWARQRALDGAITLLELTPEHA